MASVVSAFHAWCVFRLVLLAAWSGPHEALKRHEFNVAMFLLILSFVAIVSDLFVLPYASRLQRIAAVSLALFPCLVFVWFTIWMIS